MKKITSISISLIVAGCFLASGAALARKGGIPQCEVELAQCLADLVEAQAFPATGQESCWDTFGNLLESCDGTGHDGDIQAGADLWYTDNGLTITDNNTQLEWMKQDDNGGECASFPGYLDMDCTFTWDGAFAFVATLNDNNHGGYADWRVPNVKELQSIVNYENVIPAVSAEFNTGCVENCTVDGPVNACSCTAAGYWSSTSYANDPLAAWVVVFGNGGVVGGNKGLDRRVRAVRGGL